MAEPSSRAVARSDRNPLFQYTLLWLLPTGWRTLRRRGDIEESDLPLLPPSLASAVNGGRARRHFSQGYSAKAIAWRTLSPLLAVAAVFGGLQGLIGVLARPLLLRRLIELVSAGDRESGEMVTLLCVLPLVVILEGVCSAANKHLMLDLGSTKFFSTFANLVHNKAWHVQETRSKIMEVNLIGGDLVRTFAYMTILGYLFSAVVSIVGGTVMLYLTLEWASATVGLLVIGGMLTCNLSISHLAKVFERRNLTKSDERMHLMRQVVHGIRSIKLLAWEDSYLETLRAARLAECVPLRWYKVFGQMNVQLGRANPIFAACVTFSFYGLRGETLYAADLFAILNVFLSMRLALIVIPESVQFIMGIMVVLQRVQHFLDLPEAQPRSKSSKALTMTSGVHCEDLCCVWPSTGFELRNVSFLAKPSQLVAVAGPVGSGKSSLLQALLGEMGVRSGQLRRDSFKIGYAPQKPYVLAATVRENVVTGRNAGLLAVTDGQSKGEDVSEQLLAEALQRSGLAQDVEALSMGVDTLIGERGISLSGGQQQRLSLARALYGNPALLVCDDPLSALDASTAQHVFKNALRDSAGPGRTVVVALNQAYLLPKFDLVVTLQNGVMVSAGPPTVPTIGDLDHLAEGSDPDGTVAFPNGAVMDELAPPKPAGAVAQGATAAAGADKTQPKEGGAEAKEEVAIAEGAAAEGAVSRRDSGLRKEIEARGQVSWEVSRTYAQGFGRFLGFRYAFVSLTLASCALTYILMAATDRWFAHWVNEADEAPDDTEPMDYVPIYFTGCIIFMFMLVLTSALFAIGATRSAKSLHDECISQVLRAPLPFFETTPSGRILSRFSADLTVVDIALPRWADNFMQFGFTMATVIIVIAVLVPRIIAILFVSCAFFAIEIWVVDVVCRLAKRLQSMAMSPIQTVVGEAADGRAVIRAMELGHYANRRFERAVDEYCRYNYIGCAGVSGGMSIGYTTAALVTEATALVSIFFIGAEETGRVGLALTYSFVIPYFTQFFNLTLMQLKTCLPALERVMQYRSGGEVPQEADWHLPGDPKDWGEKQAVPRGMELEFVDVCLRYGPHLPLALRGASFRISPGEKIGIVGRTGAGKSTLLLLLMRIHEATSGRIMLDGRDIAGIGLMAIRRVVGVIPQVPLLFDGTVRENLDPFHRQSDAELEAVLAKAQLQAKSTEKQPAEKQLPDGAAEAHGPVPSGLLATAASDLSVGERQLMSVARSLLRILSVRVVFLDEPTSNIDLETDARVQRIVREEFASATVLTIAHRLETVVHCDRILVMDQGLAAEMGAPGLLLTDEASRLHGMAKTLGPAVLEELQKAALGHERTRVANQTIAESSL